MNYVPLHCHTTYSMGDAYGTPGQLAEAMAAAGCKAGAVTEHGNAYSWFKWNKACKAANIKPIFGVEHYIVQDMTCRVMPPRRADGIDEWRNHHNRRYHITTIALNQAGWAAEMQMLSLAHIKDPEQGGGYWFKPRIDWKLLNSHAKNLVVTSGCMSSYSSQRILGGDVDRAEAYCKRMADKFGEHWFLEIQPSRFEGQDLINHFCIDMHKKHGWPLMVTNDIHYPTADDWQKRTFLLEQNGMSNYDEYGTLYVLPPKDLLSLWLEQMGDANHKYLGLGIEGTHRIMDMVADNCMPHAPEVKFPIPEEFPDSLAFIKHLIKQGWRERDIPNTKRYRDRILKEIDILTRKEFIDQILIVWCIIDFCKRNDIMVGTRGSAAGSLVCYLIGITDLDPLDYNLLFERFVDITRNDPPDIDMDIQHNRRSEVKEFLRGLFGSDSVGDIATFGAYRAKAALDAVASKFDIPHRDVMVIKNLLVDKDNDLVGSQDKNISLIGPTVERHEAAKRVWDRHPELQLAEALDGMVKHTSKHAGGVVVATDALDLSDFAFFNETGVWSLDKKDAEGMGFLKVDALGLITMSILADARQAVIENHGVTIDYRALSLDDEDTIRGFREGDLQGIFQYEGRTARQITTRAAPQTFDEIIDINALCRPGPMYGGATEAYIAAGHGGMAERLPNEDLNRIISETRGTLIYQEQMLRVMVEVGQMSWDDVTFARRAISKRLGLDVMDKLRGKFVKGCVSVGMSEEDANSVWDRMVTFGTYAFNKSHAAAYGRVGYWCMYMKRHYPNEFYASSARHLSSDQKQRRMIQEFLIRGGKLLPPCVNQSGVSFQLEREGIRPGLADIKGIGEKAAMQIIEHRPYDPPEKVTELRVDIHSEKTGKTQRRLVINKTGREALINLGSLEGDPTMDPDKAPEFYYKFIVPAGISKLRMPSYTTCGEVEECHNMERITVVGRVNRTWNNTYADSKHRVEDSAVAKKYGQSGTEEKRTVTFKIEMEDETGEIFVTFRKHYEKNAETLKNLREGDWIIIDGKWLTEYERISGDRIEIVKTKEQAKQQERYLPEEIFG